MQTFQRRNEEIRSAYLEARSRRDAGPNPRIQLSWSNWGFGMEPLSSSLARLARHGVKFIELHGNLYGPDLGYQAAETKALLGSHGIACSGICGMFSADCDMASNRPLIRQNAVDYIRRNLDFAVEVGARYFLIVPAAVGRPQRIDDSEFARSVETLQRVAPLFAQAGVRGAIEPIRSAEVSIVHTFAEAHRYIEAVGSPGVQHINGDVYHMQAEETHIAGAILEAGATLTNLHLADSNRCALGEGSMDLDTVIMALYATGFNNDRCFATPEPLGPGGDPYPAMYGQPDPEVLEHLVATSVRTWNEREAHVRGLTA